MCIIMHHCKCPLMSLWQSHNHHCLRESRAYLTSSWLTFSRILCPSSLVLASSSRSLVEARRLHTPQTSETVGGCIPARCKYICHLYCCKKKKSNSNNTRSTNNPGPLSSLKMQYSQTDMRLGIQTWNYKQYIIMIVHRIYSSKQ